MVPAPPAGVWVGGVSTMGSFDKNFGGKKVPASTCVTTLSSWTAEGVTLFGNGLCTNV